MLIKGQVVVITGGAQGLGEALASSAIERGAAAVIIGDLRDEQVAETAQRLGIRGVVADVSTQSGVERLISGAIEEAGRVDLYISNAGIGERSGVFEGDDTWLRHWSTHVMAHVWAARALLPAMIERGHGGLVTIASSVALSSQPGTAAYNATKHAALALAETLALDHTNDGVYIGCACPQGMRTPMLMKGLERVDSAIAAFGLATALEPLDAASRILDGVEAGQFLILTHPEARTYAERRAADHDRWLNGMRRMYDRLSSGSDPV
jgi:NAD(P)-dependent dehydrogenase (short-subunit alcohol dehydrogenase family)